MPSRPVLIGRGLVPTTYKTTHAQTNEHTHAVRVHYAVPDQQTHTPTGGEEVEVERVTAAIAKRETPGPIPNPEVKPFSADGTATERLWESRTPPDIHCGSGVTFGWPHFCVPGQRCVSVATRRPQAAARRHCPQVAGGSQGCCRSR